MSGLRLLLILRVAWRHGILEFIPGQSWLARLLRYLSRRPHAPRGERLRLTLETLGPIFVKFGQMLSTRRDLLPADIADELEKLQDRVPPFPSAAAIATLERALGAPVSQRYRRFDEIPVASASVAQVHFAELPDGREVAVKILRPGIARTIAHDLELLRSVAWLLQRLLEGGQRFRLPDVVEEFAQHLEDELDLMREAANCSQLRRNFAGSPLIQVPEVYWDWCAVEVMTMERMAGIPVNRIEALRAAGIDLKQLARNGVEIFFTQVFRDAYFHADMHPGNILVAAGGRYVALDFGIMGSLTETDQHYLAINFLAFFNRDYRRVAEAHIECGWAPAGTRVDAFEAAIRAVCEPIFDKPIAQISLGRVLLRLFQTSRRFGMEIQPQLVMLQKTLISIEGLGRQLDPELDLWATAKPFLEAWMKERLGVRRLLARVAQEWPHWAQTLPELPRRLQATAKQGQDVLLRAYLDLARRQHRQLVVLCCILAVLALGLFSHRL